MIKDPVSTATTAIAKGVETIGGVFTSNKENDAQRASDEQMALLKSYQAEFNNRENRGRIDEIADGFNRLIRPFIVTLVLFIFIIAYVAPDRLKDISAAMALIPDGYWALLSVIIAFYFGGRMQLKSQQFKMNESQIQAVTALVEKKKGFNDLAMDKDEPDKVVGDAAGKSPKVDEVRVDLVNTVVEEAANDNSKEALAKAVKKLAEEDAETVVKRRRIGKKRFGRM